ncbi:hypothetical protein [Thiorhodococcus minor]|uniref:TubC N-terminal docking domain-containing protein n=1 Tax=Thiorhodococcus minor TaxID=57489 RepID=A0A6M0K0Z0_9GAMM|nr:hypothetical protein [Thiorhodococcus minor]NEV62267.1 hypothetical protein [Thiorhodococcus minor]
MQNAAALLDTLAADGIQLTADGDRLVAVPSGRLTDAHRAEIRALKPELLALLQSANDGESTPQRCWLVRYPDGRELSITRSPPATLAEMQADYPGAEVQPEPEPPLGPPLSPNAQAVAEALLDHWGESDPTTRAEYIDGLRRNPECLRQCFDAAVAACLARWPE